MNEDVFARGLGLIFFGGGGLMLAVLAVWLLKGAWDDKDLEPGALGGLFTLLALAGLWTACFIVWSWPKG